MLQAARAFKGAFLPRDGVGEGQRAGQQLQRAAEVWRDLRRQGRLQLRVDLVVQDGDAQRVEVGAQLVFLARLPVREVTLPALEQALELLTRLHERCLEL